MSPTRRSRAVPAAVTLLLIAAALVVIAAGWRTSNARVSATTENAANRWSAGTVELDSEAARSLELSVHDIWPGRTVEDCVLVRYSGSVPDVDVRAYGRLDDGTGLEAFIVATIEVGRGGGEGTCDGFDAHGVAFRGDLEALAATTYQDAPSLLPRAGPGDEVTLRIALDVRDDNAAQGLSTTFALVLEARP